MKRRVGTSQEREQEHVWGQAGIERSRLDPNPEGSIQEKAAGFDQGAGCAKGRLLLPLQPLSLDLSPESLYLRQASTPHLQAGPSLTFISLKT